MNYNVRKGANFNGCRRLVLNRSTPDRLLLQLIELDQNITNQGTDNGTCDACTVVAAELCKVLNDAKKIIHE